MAGAKLPPLSDEAKAAESAARAACTACADPGPFVYTPPDAKPIEAACAHSPPGTAVSPPNTKAPAAEMAPVKKP